MRDRVAIFPAALSCRLQKCAGVTSRTRLQRRRVEGLACAVLPATHSHDTHFPYPLAVVVTTEAVYLPPTRLSFVGVGPMPLRLFPLYFRGSSVSWRLCVVRHSDTAERVSAVISTNQERLLAMQFVPPASYVRAAVGDGVVNKLSLSSSATPTSASSC